MYRSASANRVTDDHLNYLSSSASSSKFPTALRALSLEANELPVYEPFSDATKKHRNRAKFARNAVHIIPFVLLFCALILWIFSNPDIDMQTKDDTAAAKVEGLTIGGGDVDSHDIRSANLHLKLEDLESKKQDGYPKASILGKRIS